MFYKTVVMAVLLFGRERWNPMVLALKRAEDFHMRCLYCMAVANKPHRNPNGSWLYPDLADICAEVGVHSIAHYVQVRHNTIAQFFVDCLIHDLGMDERRRRDTHPRQYWGSNQ